jgi:DNA segregation ATPase FtsK/SpoIIIE, S-DNA-T family
VAAAAIHPPSALHVYVLDGGSSLTELAGLPHVGATIGPTEIERQARLIRRLGAMLHRGGSTDSGPRVVLVVDRLAAWRQAVAERLGPELAGLLDRILVEGPAAGVVVAGGLDRPGALPLAVSGAVGERLVFRLGDPADATTAGLRAGAVAGLPRGRAVLAGSGLSVQVASPTDLASSVRAVVDHWGCGDRLGGATAVACLPTDVAVSALGTAVTAGVRTGGARPRSRSIAFGLGDDDLEPVVLTMHPGDPFLITGPVRSGRSSALALIAQQLRQADADARIFAVTPRPSPLADLASIITVTASIEGLVEVMGAPRAGRSPGEGSGGIVLVDDADLVDDPAGALAHLLEGGGEPGHVIAAGRTDAFRAAYGHWTQTLRRRRRGLILCPESDLDGDVLGMTLPRWPSSPPAPGRGYLVAEGRCALVQLARCDLARFDPVWSRSAE